MATSIRIVNREQKVAGKGPLPVGQGFSVSRPPFAAHLRFYHIRLTPLYLFTVYCFLLLFTLTACADQPLTVGEQPLLVTLTVDGQTTTLETTSSNVRELLEETNISLGDTDLVDPPLFTPLTPDLSINIIRVTESLEIIEQTIAFSRKSVRNEGMNADDPPVILQVGQTGLQEVTIRIIYHDGLEVERQIVRVTDVEPAQDEILMVGIGATPGTLVFSGNLAYISGGNALILRGSTAFPQQLNTGSPLDGRVFKLSPTGGHLLYTRRLDDGVHFNELWLVGTGQGAVARRLGVYDILWADWNPAVADETALQIAYTTGIRTELPPGWEANNDLWLATITVRQSFNFVEREIIETYPATYGWWGGNYAWSPSGRYIAYSFADEIGVIDVQTPNEDEQRRQLYRFTEYNTRRNWVWVPTLSWSPDGRYLTFTVHGGTDADAIVFDSYVADVGSNNVIRFVEQVGMWGHPNWSPLGNELFAAGEQSSQIAFLRATNPLESESSSYTLWLMDQDGSNARQVYPAVGENSRFPRNQQFMAWGASGRDMAFVFNNGLYVLNLDTGEAHRITQDETGISTPTWAPYGAGITAPAQAVEELPLEELPPGYEFLNPDN
ncbi:MAG: DUF348 domain-containing protein [Chloroflexi bacterium]|nr:DUF348 domain-containing protein [Chloroflexota bacterium]MBP8057038.1 DUF348 domain-containing protein [Chloroflexota bacterium]